MKNIIHLVIQVFTYICNISFATGIYPDAMKIAKIIPIYKLVQNMNLIIIDLFRYFHKLIKFLRSYLMIDWKNLSVKIISYQTANFDSELAGLLAWQLLVKLKKTTTSLDNMKAVISVFIDLKKAFDTIDHTILLQKLNHYEIRGIVNQWLCSY